MFGGRKKLNLEKFLIFNQQFVTLIRAGLPILKGLDLLADRLTDPKLEPYIKAVRDEVRNGTLLSDAFRQQGIFPKIYISSVMAGEKSGSLTEVLDRYIHYQKLSLAVRKKVMVSLMYPCVLIVLVMRADGVSGDLRGAHLRHALQQHAGHAAADDGAPDRHRHHGAQLHSGALSARLIAADLRVPLVGAAAQRRATPSTASRLKIPLLGDIWLKYQVAQLSRILSTLLTGRHSAGAGAWKPPPIRWVRRCCRRPWRRPARACAKASRSRARCKALKMFPPLAIDMIEVGESTGALPQC